MAEVDRLADVLLEAPTRSTTHPELAFEEHLAHDLLTDVLEGDGLAVERGRLRPRHRVRGPGRHRRARRSPCCASTTPCPASATPAATTSSPPPASAPAWPRPRWPTSSAAGCVILGTPAEEGGGGKVLMAEQGAFDGVDAAMMVHPAGADLRGMDAIAIQQRHGRTTTGVAAHAAAAPAARAATPSTPPCSAT